MDAYFAGLSPSEQEKFIGLDAAAQDRELSANSPAYQNAKQWGIGGANSRALEAVTTLLVGATSGQVGSQVVANALAPYAAQLIGETFDPNKPSTVPSEAMQLLSHALLGALLAEVNGGSAASGAGAAAGGELAAKLITEALYPGKVGDLDDQQKANILALSQAVGALAGGIGSDLAGAALGAGMARNSVEHNWLSQHEWDQYLEAKKGCSSSGGGGCIVAERLEALSAERDAARADYINAAREGLVAAGYAITPQLMAAVDRRFWEKQGVDFNDARFLGVNVQETYKGMYQELTEFYARAAEYSENPSTRFMASLNVGILESLGQTWGSWTGINPANGIPVVGLEAKDGRFLTVVDIATALVGGGTGGARALGRPLLDEAAEAVFSQNRKFWISDPIGFEGNRVFQRNDIFDPELITTWRDKGRVVSGTNVERMASGRAPIGTDGYSVNLHHMTQDQGGAIAEMTQSFHQINGGVIHINPSTIPSGIDRNSFSRWREKYWIDRSKAFGEK